MSDVMRITTGEVRLSFVKVFKPGDSGKYEVTCLLPKSDVATKQKIDEAIAAAKQIGATTKWGGTMPPVIPTPLHDGDGVRSDGTPFGPECKGCWVFTPRSNDRPLVVDTDRQEILDQSMVYSGAFGKVNFSVYPYLYTETRKKGIAFGLNGVQKLRDGEPLAGGRQSADQMFGDSPVTPGFVPAGSVDPITGLPMA